MICATVSYALMNLVMTSSPLAVVGCGFDTGDAADVVTAHVLAMYAPSFFTGHIIARFGVERVIALGLIILAGAGAVAMAGVELENFFVALILLGIGWNFGFIGATTMLTAAQRPEERGRLQGLNDLIVFGGVTLASFSSGGLMNCSGGSVQAGWQTGQPGDAALPGAGRRRADLALAAPERIPQLTGRLRPRAASPRRPTPRPSRCRSAASPGGGSRCA